MPDLDKPEPKSIFGVEAGGRVWVSGSQSQSGSFFDTDSDTDTDTDPEKKHSGSGLSGLE